MSEVGRKALSIACPGLGQENEFMYSTCSEGGRGSQVSDAQPDNNVDDLKEKVRWGEQGH